MSPLRATLIIAVAVMSALSASYAESANAAESSAPNFIFLLADDLGWSQLSRPMDPAVAEAASSYLETPNLARLQERGMRFTSGYSPAPLCTPTRRSIQCGMTPARQRGTEFKSEFDWSGPLTLAVALKSANPAYRCAHFGKYGEEIDVTPEAIGYDESDGFTGNKTGGCPQDMTERGATVVNDDPKLTASMTARAMDFVTRQTAAKKPFYVQLSYYATHLQVQTRPEMLEKYVAKGEPDRAITHGFAGMLEDLDEAVGSVLDTVDSLGIAGNTYVIFTADNGGRGTIPGADESLSPPNRPLFGAKHSLYEGGIRVPFIAMGPGVEADSLSHVPVTAYDLLPTLYDLAGGTDALPNDIDGGSFRSVLTGGGLGQVERGFEGLVFHRPLHRADPQSAIRVGDWKLMILWKVRQRERQVLLFNLAQDLGEQNDLSSTHPEKVAELERLLIGYLKSVNAEAPREQEIE